MKDLVSLMVLEVSVLSHLAPWQGVHGRAKLLTSWLGSEESGRGGGRERREERERQRQRHERPGSEYPPSRASPPSRSIFLLLGPPPAERFHHLTIMPSAEDQVFNTWTLGMIKIQIITSILYFQGTIHNYFSKI
jgi:hypothetical protein